MGVCNGVGLVGKGSPVGDKDGKRWNKMEKDGQDEKGRTEEVNRPSINAWPTEGREGKGKERDGETVLRIRGTPVSSPAFSPPRLVPPQSSLPPSHSPPSPLSFPPWDEPIPPPLLPSLPLLRLFSSSNH